MWGKFGKLMSFDVYAVQCLQKGKPVALFKHHTAPITSVEWHPTDGTVFAASGSDDQLTLWDLAVEKDSEDSGKDSLDVPPQLLFIHQVCTGQEVKSVFSKQQILEWLNLLSRILLETYFL